MTKNEYLFSGNLARLRLALQAIECCILPPQAEKEKSLLKIASDAVAELIEKHYDEIHPDGRARKCLLHFDIPNSDHTERPK